jgi:hypothetical protein
MQTHELEAWLGDDHGLTDEQVDELAQTAEDITRRYPDHDDTEEREAALTVAYRLMVEDNDAVISSLAEDLTRARLAENRALAGIRQAALAVVPNGGTESGFARRAGVDRMAVRNWLGKR